MKIEGFRSLNQDIATIINKSDKVKQAKNIYVFDHYNFYNILALRRMSFYSSEKRFRQGAHHSLPFIFPAYPRPRGRIMAAGG